MIKLPWLSCYLGLGAAFYGQGRAAGYQPLTTVAFDYLLMSMPLLNVQVALAGYADLLLAACHAAAIMTFHNWSVTKSPGQSVLAVIFALFCHLIKNEGMFWLLTFIPGLILIYLPLRKALLLLAAGVALVVLAVLFLPPDLVIAGHSLADLKLEYRSQTLAAIGISFLMQDNWHLLGYLLIALIAIIMVTPRALPRSCTLYCRGEDRIAPGARSYVPGTGALRRNRWRRERTGP